MTARKLAWCTANGNHRALPVLGIHYEIGSAIWVLETEPVFWDGLQTEARPRVTRETGVRPALGLGSIFQRRSLESLGDLATSFLNPKSSRKEEWMF